MDRYIALDAHASSCTVATVGSSGRRLHSQVVETNAGALIRVLRGVPGTRHLCLEEGTHARWLYEVLSPHVEEIVVAGVRESRGRKSDKLDAFGLAEQLRIGAVKRKVYKKRGEFGALRHRAKAYTLLVADSVRVQNRIKSLFRPVPWPSFLCRSRTVCWNCDGRPRRGCWPRPGSTGRGGW
jgi:hypothetical protein